MANITIQQAINRLADAIENIEKQNIKGISIPGHATPSLLTFLTYLKTSLENIQLTPGPAGPQGQPGTAGVSIISTKVRADGKIAFELSNGTETNGIEIPLPSGVITQSVLDNILDNYQKNDFSVFDNFSLLDHQTVSHDATGRKIWATIYDLREVKPNEGIAILASANMSLEIKLCDGENEYVANVNVYNGVISGIIKATNIQYGGQLPFFDIDNFTSKIPINLTVEAIKINNLSSSVIYVKVLNAETGTKPLHGVITEEVINNVNYVNPIAPIIYGGDHYNATSSITLDTTSSPSDENGFVTWNTETTSLLFNTIANIYSNPYLRWKEPVSAGEVYVNYKSTQNPVASFNGEFQAKLLGVKNVSNEVQCFRTEADATTFGHLKLGDLLTGLDGKDFTNGQPLYDYLDPSGEYFGAVELSPLMEWVLGAGDALKITAFEIDGSNVKFSGISSNGAVITDQTVPYNTPLIDNTTTGGQSTYVKFWNTVELEIEATPEGAKIPQFYSRNKKIDGSTVTPSTPDGQLWFSGTFQDRFESLQLSALNIEAVVQAMEVGNAKVIIYTDAQKSKPNHKRGEVVLPIVQAIPIDGSNGVLKLEVLWNRRITQQANDSVLNWLNNVNPYTDAGGRPIRTLSVNQALIDFISQYGGSVKIKIQNTGLNPHSTDAGSGSDESNGDDGGDIWGDGNV